VSGRAEYAEFITSLPEVELPVAGIRAWLSQGPDHQVVFFDIDTEEAIPLHRHGEQWGVVVEGEMELTIDGVTRRRGPGDSYHIPAGVEHGARFLTRVRAIDVFAERDRYSVR